MLGLVQLHRRWSSGGLGSSGAVCWITFEPLTASNLQSATIELLGRILKKEASSVCTKSAATADAVPIRLEVEGEEIVNFALIILMNALVRSHFQG